MVGSCSRFLVLLKRPCQYAYALEYEPRLSGFVDEHVTNDELRKDLPDEGRQTWVLEILRREQHGQHGLDQQLAVGGLVFPLLGCRRRVAGARDRRKGRERPQRVVCLVRIHGQRGPRDGRVCCAVRCSN